RPRLLNQAVKGRAHPPVYRVPGPSLDVLDGLAGVALEPVPIEVLGHPAELDDQVAGEILRFDFAPFLLPQAYKGGFVSAHDDAGVRATDEGPAVIWAFPHS